MQNRLTDFIRNYKLKPEVINKINITHNKALTVDTLKVFHILHPDLDKVYLKAIKSILQKIYKNDKIINFEKTNIFYHTYRILVWIYQYTKILDFYQSDDYKKYSFAKHKSAKSKFKRNYTKERQELFDKNTYTGDNRVHAFALRKYLLHRDLMDIYFNATTLFPKYNINYELIKEVEEADTMTVNVVKKIHTYYSSSYIDSEDVIFESLAIILNGYMKLKMKMKSKVANSITNELLYTLFNYQVEKTSSDRLTNIYISGRVDNMPIFKNSKEDIFPIADKEKFSTLLEEAKQDFGDNDNILLDTEAYFHSNPLKAYFEQYPMEFLSKVE